ncbi:MAG TPA: hypothetical protein VF850_07770 [Gemmatimonadaceae bacterium]
MLTKKSRLLLGLTAAVPLLFAACTDNNIFNPMADAAGTYQLTVYAGRTIPATFTIQPGDPTYGSYAPNGGTLAVTGGNLVLSSNGAFVETNNYVITPNGGGAPSNVQFQSSGTWTLNGTIFSLSDPSRGRQVSGTLEADLNNNLTVNYTEDDGTGTFQSYEYKR